MNFIVLSYARSGTTWLVNTLNNISDVTCYDELFTLKELRYRGGASDFPFYLEWKDSQKHFPFIWRYLDELYSGKQKTGFKLMFHQAKNNWGLWPYVLKKKIGIIHLIRRNALDMVLSLLAAQNRGKFHFKDNEEIPNEPPIHVDTAFLVRRIKKVHKNTKDTRKTLNFFRLKSIEVYYEDLLSDKQNFKSIWDFLEVDYLREPPKWQIQKSRKKSKSQIVLNYDEVKDALRVAGLDYYLND